MLPFNRNYCILTEEEERYIRELKEAEVIYKLVSSEIRKSRFRDYPKAARHYEQLFPNNYLDIVELKNEITLHNIIKQFHALLESPNVNERAILKFIRENQAYFIIGSLLHKYFRFGHHEAHIFPEFQLGNSFAVDYLLAGKNSDGWHFVLVEMEAPLGKITISDGSLGESFRKGIRQTEDWDQWIENYYSSIQETFVKYKHPNKMLPTEFSHLDKSRFNYVVIAGRRSDFSDTTYRKQRKEHKNGFLHILHYDNLIDAAFSVIGESTY